MPTPSCSSVLGICLLCVYMTCRSEQDSNVTAIQDDTNCMPGYFGRGCNRKCPGVCSKSCDNHGLCITCSRPGVQLPNCTTECPRGFSGLHCMSRCLECKRSDCNPESGECKQCRFPGLRVPLCKHGCLQGTFGRDCKNRCPLPCRESCDVVTGDCKKCQHGLGPRCQINCASPDNFEPCRRYCLGRCLTWCNSSHGTCGMCAAGFKPPYCREPCEEGRFGPNCAEKCSSRCMGGRCDPTTGVCYACSDGYVGERCNGQCISGFYGAGCTSSCPPTCADGLCQFTTGHCLRCHPGYTGPECDQLCGSGHFGEGCQFKCPVTCGGQCDPVSGECWTCLPGYVGLFCNDSCQQGTHGQGCTNVCPAGCLKHACDHVTGECVACEDNLTGKFCDQSETSTSMPTHVLVLVSLLMAFVVFALIISILCFRRKVKKAQERKAANQSERKEEITDGSFKCDQKQKRETLQYLSTEATQKQPGLRSLPGTCKHTQPDKLSANLFARQAYLPPQTQINGSLDLSLPSGILPTRGQHGVESHAQIRQEIERGLARLMKMQSRGMVDHVTTSNAFCTKRLVKSAGQSYWPSGTRVVKKQSVMDLSTFGKTSERHREQPVCPSDGRAISIRRESSTETRDKQEIVSDGQSGRKTKITLLEHTECMEGKTTVSTAWSVNLPPNVLVVPSRQAPEAIIAQPRDSLGSGPIISSADSLFGLPSTDLSREVSKMSQKISHLKAQEQKSQTQNKPPIQHLAVNTIRASSSHIYPNSRTSVTRNGNLMRRPPSVHSLPDISHCAQLTCVPRPGHASCDNRNQVTSNDKVIKTDLTARGRNLTTRHEISIHEHRDSAPEKPSSLSETLRISCQRSFVVSDSSKSTRPASHSDRQKPVSSHGCSHGSMNKVDKRSQLEQCSVLGDETMAHSESNSWCNCEDLDTAACCDTSSHSKANDPKRAPSSGAARAGSQQDTVTRAKGCLGSSSYHRLPTTVKDLTPPKQLVKTDVSSDDVTQNESSDVFQYQSDHLPTVHRADTETKTRQAARSQDDVSLHSASSKMAASCKGPTRGSVLGDSVSPKLIRCATTRQVSPMYSHTTSLATSRLQPLPTPPPEGIKVLRPVRKHSMSSSSSESQLPDQETSK